MPHTNQKGYHIMGVIVSNYRLWMATAYFAAFLLQIPLLIQQMPAFIGVDTSFNTYTPAVIMMICGCLLFIVDRLLPEIGKRFKLQLFSAMLLGIGSSVWCICGVSWSSRLCAAMFPDSRMQRDECWASTFFNFFAITCMVLYLAMSVVDDLFQPRARLTMSVMVNCAALLHLILYLVLNNMGPHEMTGNLKFYYYMLIVYVGTSISLSAASLFTGQNVVMNSTAYVSFSLTTVSGMGALLCTFLIIYGSANYWFTQKINAGDGAAFFGYTIFYSTANIWIMVELYLYQQDRLAKNALRDEEARNYKYDAVTQIDLA